MSVLLLINSIMYVVGHETGLYSLFASCTVEVLCSCELTDLRATGAQCASMSFRQAEWHHTETTERGRSAYAKARVQFPTSNSLLPWARWRHHF